jgi:hypothetical protein
MIPKLLLSDLFQSGPGLTRWPQLWTLEASPQSFDEVEVREHLVESVDRAATVGAHADGDVAQDTDPRPVGRSDLPDQRALAGTQVDAEGIGILIFGDNVADAEKPVVV